MPGVSRIFLIFFFFVFNFFFFFLRVPLIAILVHCPNIRPFTVRDLSTVYMLLKLITSVVLITELGVIHIRSEEHSQIIVCEQI